MSAPPKRQSLRTCEKKLYFNDEFQARANALEVIEAYGQKALWIYRCPECKGWHMTKKDNGVLWKVTRFQPFQG